MRSRALRLVIIAVALAALALPSALLASEPAPGEEQDVRGVTLPELPRLDLPAPPADPAPSPGPRATPIAGPAPVQQSARAAASASATVSIEDGSSTDAYRFVPEAVTIQVGESVTWINNGTAPEGHDVSGDGFQSPILQQGESYSHTFSSAGAFPYICSIHPFMKATVNVEASTTDGGTSGDAGSTGDVADTEAGGSPGGATAPDTTGPGSESEAVVSPGAAGSAETLPATGLGVLPLSLTAVALLGAGLALRGRARALARHDR